MIFGIDIGTTSVSGVAVDDARQVVASETVVHGADLPSTASGVCEQDPEKLLKAVDAVLAALEGGCGSPSRIGWTGQMHGVVGVDASLRAVTPFVTWRDARRYGGRVMAGWAAEHRGIHRCLPICGYVLARRTGRCTIDRTFLHSWYLDELEEPVRERIRGWLPEVEDGTMLGDNQAGVMAAQTLLPGAAVVNLGTSSQLSIVVDEPFSGAAVPGDGAADGVRTERRPYPDGRTLLCRAGISGGRAWAELRSELGLNWEEMNASDDPRVLACAERIVGELVDGIDLKDVVGVIGTGNGLVRNPALKRAVERCFGVVCRIPGITELAAYGATLAVNQGEGRSK